MADRVRESPVDPAVLELAGRALESIHQPPPDRLDLVTLKGDASSRSYHRMHLPGRKPSSLVLMQLAMDPLESDEFTDWDPPEYPFTLVQRYLEQGHLPVPRIHGARPEEGWLVLQDLGDVTLESVLLSCTPSGMRGWYARAVDLLVRWQHWWRRSEAENPVRERVFSRRLLSWELDHYVQWGLEARLDRKLTDPERSRLDELFTPLLDELTQIPTVLVHRDYQSRNLMVVGQGERPSLVLIDFQDALMGPAVYDAVALMCDSYIDIPADLQLDMVQRLRQSAFPDVDPERFARWFHVQTVQRKLKDAGRFVFIHRVKGNPDFLPHIPRSLEYVQRSLRQLDHMDDLYRTLKDMGGLDAA